MVFVPLKKSCQDVMKKIKDWKSGEVQKELSAAKRDFIL
jgi:hypothetical protein